MKIDHCCKHPVKVENEDVASFKAQPFSNELLETLDDMPSVKVDAKKWAFIIAAEKYDETDSVAFSKNSGEMFKRVAQKVLGVGERRTYALIGDDATTGKIKSRLNKLMQFVGEGDTIYFYYSGHGIPDIKSKEAYLLPKDVDPAYISDEPQFKLVNIYAKLASTKAKKVIAMVDSCFAGATDNKTLFKGVAATRLRTKHVEIDDSKMVVMTAGQDKQFSNMYKEEKMRLFSYYLVQNLINGKKDVRSIYRSLKRDVEDRSFNLGDQYYQSPTLSGKSDLQF
jgi:hypothetical protein